MWSLCVVRLPTSRNMTRVSTESIRLFLVERL